MRVVYASAATKPFSTTMLRDLLAVARARNTALGVGGVLLYQSQSFLQVLEGDPAQVEPLYHKIAADRRHQRMLLLLRESIERRIFGEWSMGFVDLERTLAPPGFVELTRHVTSFHDLAGDSAMLRKLMEAFLDGRWRQAIR